MTPEEREEAWEAYKYSCAWYKDSLRDVYMAGIEAAENWKENTQKDGNK